MTATTASKVLVTADELLLRPDDGMRYELIEGELNQMAPAGAGHGMSAMEISWPLAQFVKEHRLGRVFVAETGFKITQNPDTVLAPDAAFVRAERIAQTGIPKGYFPGAPDLAVEVVSPGDTVYEVDEKVERWLGAGCLQVWIVNPKRRTVTVHTPTDERLLRESDVLDGGDLLPGFSLRVSEIFA